MRVTLDEVAYNDLERIHAWIAKDRPIVADEVVDRILTSIENLGYFPFMGHTGRVPNTYEWVIGGLPYIVVYEVGHEREELTVTGVFHGAQDR